MIWILICYRFQSFNKIFFLTGVIKDEERDMHLTQGKKDSMENIAESLMYRKMTYPGVNYLLD